MVFTVPGIVMDLSESQSRKAEEPIFVTVFGIVTSLSLALP